jgi:hypothetical integral membrane protein (TIGR02206 family)
VQGQQAVSIAWYGPTHWALLIVTAVGAVALVWFGRRARGTALERRFTRGFAIVQIAVTFGFMAIWLAPAYFSLGQSLPLQLSDLLRLVAGYALWSRRWWAVALTYYWGLTLNPQALLTPDVHPDVAPALELASYWIQHIVVMWVPIYLTWGLGLRPSWRGYRVALAVTLGWAATTVLINTALGTNYGYLNRKPAGGSLLDVMGPWPWYLVAALLAAAGVWALITWPWTRRSAGRRAASL